MTKEEKKQEAQKKVLSLLSKELKTTKAIREEGRKQGYFQNWVTYSRHLEDLVKQGKVEKIPTSAGIFWKKK